MPLQSGSCFRLAAPVSMGGRLFVPVVRILTVSYERGGIASSTPVALLIREDGAWSFVSLEEGITQEVLRESGLFPVEE